MFTCVSIIMPSVGLIIESQMLMDFIDMEKEFRLKCTPGPQIAEGLVLCLISVAFGEVCVTTCLHLMCFVCAKLCVCVCVYLCSSSAQSSIYSLHGDYT